MCVRLLSVYGILVLKSYINYSCIYISMYIGFIYVY